MKPKWILALYLTLMTGLFLTAALVRFPASLAAGPPPTGSPQVTKVSHSFPLDLADVITQSASQPVRVVEARLDSSSIPLPATRPRC